MAATELVICNSALLKVGATAISALSDNNKRAILCNAHYSKVRDDLLRMHPWNFATFRAALTEVTQTFADGDVTTGTDNINITAHGLVTRDRIYLTTSGTLPSGLSANVTYFVVRVDDDNFKLATTAANAKAGTVIDITAAAGGGTHTVHEMPLFDWDYKYSKPTSYLRSIKLQSESEFAVENDYIVTDDADAYMIYIKQITDTTKFDSNFDELLALMLAYELSYPLVQSNSLKATLQNELQAKLRDVRSFDAQEGTPEDFEADTWIDSRI